jgi:hypothetical protein
MIKKKPQKHSEKEERSNLGSDDSITILIYTNINMRLQKQTELKWIVVTEISMVSKMKQIQAHDHQPTAKTESHEQRTEAGTGNRRQRRHRNGEKTRLSASQKREPRPKQINRKSSMREKNRIQRESRGQEKSTGRGWRRGHQRSDWEQKLASGNQKLLAAKEIDARLGAVSGSGYQDSAHYRKWE